jgi:predicted Na+-dependent transporter
LLGLAAIILTSIIPANTEAGAMVFGILAVIWGVVFLAMGLQIMRQDMD